MKDKDIYWDLFDRQHKNQLSGEEADLLRNALETDPEVREEYESYKLIVDSILSLEIAALKNELKDQLEQKPGIKPVPGSIKSLKIVLAIAASTIIGLFVFNHLYFHEKVLQRYALSNYKVNLMDAPHSTEDPLNHSPLEEAFILEQEGELDAAISILDNIKVTSEEYYDDYFIAQYELALIYIEKKELDKSKQILIALTNRPENHIIKKDAQQLLNDLKRPRIFYF